MNYNKTTWATGDVVTAEKLNNIENGVSSLQPIVLTNVQNEQEDMVLCYLENNEPVPLTKNMAEAIIETPLITIFKVIYTEGDH